VNAFSALRPVVPRDVAEGIQLTKHAQGQDVNDMVHHSVVITEYEDVSNSKALETTSVLTTSFVKDVSFNAHTVYAGAAYGAGFARDINVE
jgi:hypothetical protein